MKISLRSELPQIVLIAVMFVLAAITWPSAPDRIATHWNLHGQVDGYGGKFSGLLLLPLLALGLYLLLLLLPLLDPGRANYRNFARAYTIIRLAVLVLLAAIYGVTILWIHGIELDMARVVPVLLGLLFIAIGSVLGKVRPNWFVGIRTPWTLSSKRSWVKTHRLGGYLFVLAGFTLVVAGLITSTALFPVVFGLLIALTLVLVAYSYVQWRRDPEKQPPSGSLPG